MPSEMICLAGTVLIGRPANEIEPLATG
jgi:hypothetical protein